MLFDLVSSVVALLLALSPSVATPSSASMSAAAAEPSAGGKQETYKTTCQRGHEYTLTIAEDGKRTIAEKPVADANATAIVTIVTQRDGKKLKRICTSGFEVDAMAGSPAGSPTVSSNGGIFGVAGVDSNATYAPLQPSYLQYFQCAFDYGPCAAPSAAELTTYDVKGSASAPEPAVVNPAPTLEQNAALSAPQMPAAQENVVQLRPPQTETDQTASLQQQNARTDSTFGQSAGPQTSSPSESQPSWLDWRRIFSAPGMIVCFLIPSDCKVYQYIKQQGTHSQQ